MKGCLQEGEARDCVLVLQMLAFIPGTQGPS